MPLEAPDTEPLVTYQLPFPPDALAEIVVPKAVPEDERIWVPQAENVHFRPLCLNRSQGYWVNLLRVRKAGVLSRHLEDTLGRPVLDRIVHQPTGSRRYRNRPTVADIAALQPASTRH